MPTNRNRSSESARRKQRSIHFNICLRCSGPRDSDSLVCNSCLEKRRQKRKQQDSQRKSASLCRCGRKPEDGKELCKDCLERGKKNASTQRIKHKEMGGCITCGKPPMLGTTTCQECAARATRRTLERYESNKEKGICPFCGENLDDKFRCAACHKNHLKNGKARWHQQRLVVLQHYGGKCVCCEETTHEFLEIDHIGGGGAKHRKEVGSHMMEWIIKNDFPDDLQVLCANCNRGRGKFGNCPHAVEPPLPSSKHGRRYRRRRLQAIENYGGKCVCCGEDNWAFLEFDHINNDGNLHRETVKNLVYWLIRNNYPDNIQLLCSNCNRVKQFYPALFEQMTAHDRKSRL